MSRRISPWSLVEIEWWDAHSCEAGWQDLDTVLSSHGPLLILSVGYLAHQDQQGLSLLASRRADEPIGSGHTFIPHACVRTINVLREGETK